MRNYHEAMFEGLELTESERAFMRNAKASCRPQVNERVSEAHGVIKVWAFG